MSYYSSNKNIRISKICFLRESKSYKTDEKRMFERSSTVHLSSIIQSERKKAINEQFKQFSFRNMNQEKHKLSQCTDGSPNKKKQDVEKRFIQTSQQMRTLRQSQKDNFFLSEIFGQENKTTKLLQKQRQLQKQASRAKKRNFNMRRNQFRAFLQKKEVKLDQYKNEASEKKEIHYDKVQIDNWLKDYQNLLTSRQQCQNQRYHEENNSSLNSQAKRN